QHQKHQLALDEVGRISLVGRCKGAYTRQHDQPDRNQGQHGQNQNVNAVAMHKELQVTDQFWDRGTMATSVFCTSVRTGWAFGAEASWEAEVGTLIVEPTFNLEGSVIPLILAIWEGCVLKVLAIFHNVSPAITV